MARRDSKIPTQRQLRVGEEIRHVLAMFLERGEIRDPGLEGTPVTITEVRISPDLRKATVFVVPLGGGDADRVLKALGRARPFLRRQLARDVKLRNVPDLTFAEDTTFDEASRIERLLHSPEVSRDLARDDDRDGEVDEGSAHGT
ncbi:MAG: 30S ribosome-binding factor RbfA [Rhodospirillales bacterium]|nr:30S ribosome-binding factor RbfA [Rhodospirillales bacterium]